jgi:hypothetical protein
MHSHSCICSYIHHTREPNVHTFNKKQTNKNTHFYTHMPNTIHTHTHAHTRIRMFFLAPSHLSTLCVSFGIVSCFRWFLFKHAHTHTLTHTHTHTHQPKTVDLIAALPEEYKDALTPILRAKPIRTASGVAVVAVMCKPHRCPHIAMTGNICVYW